MVTNQIKTRILNKISTWSEWEAVKSTFKPLRGEICIVEIPTGTSSSGLTPPATGIKVGDGEHFFGDLPWIQATAGDVSAFIKTIDKEETFNSKVNALISAATSTSLAELNSAIDSLEGRMDTAEDKISTLESTVGNATSGLVQTVASHTTSINSLSTNKADKTQVATDISNAKSAVVGTSSDAAGATTVYGALKAAAAAQSKADEAESNAQTGIANAATAQAAAETADAKAVAAQGTADSALAKANTNASNITTIQEQITEINETLGGSSGTSVVARLDAIEEKNKTQDTAIESNTDAISAEKSRAEGVEAGLRTDVDKVLTFFDVDPNKSAELVDTLKELQDYIASDTSGAATMASNIQANTTAIATEKARAEGKEAELQSNIDTLKTDLLGDATYKTDTIASVKAAAAAASQKADTNLATAKTYAENQAKAVLGQDGDSASTKTVYGAHAAAAAASSAAATADSKAVAAQTTATAADTLSKSNKSVLDTVLGSSIADADGVIETISFGSDNKIAATRKKIDMDDMSDTATFVFYCGTATEVV